MVGGFARSRIARFPSGVVHGDGQSLCDTVFGGLSRFAACVGDRGRALGPGRFL